MKSALFHILCFFTYFNVQGQLAISDQKFSWLHYPECTPLDTSAMIYAKAEIDPLLIGINSVSFDFLITRMSDIIGLGEGESGFIKVKLLFDPQKSICVRAIGTMGLTFNFEEYKVILAHFSKLKDFTPGEMYDRPVSSIGIITIQVSEKGVEDYQIANFSF